MDYYETITIKHKKVYGRQRKNRKELPSYFNFFDNLPEDKNKEKSFKKIDVAIKNYKLWKNVTIYVKREDIIFVLHDLKNLDKFKVPAISRTLQVSNSTIRNWIKRYSI